MNIFFLFFCFALTLLTYITAHSSDPDPTSRESSLPGSAVSFLSTPRHSPTDEAGESCADLVARLVDNISTSDDGAVTMAAPLSPPALDTSYVETDDEDEGADTLVSPLNLNRKDTILAADDEGVHLTHIKRHLKKYTIVTVTNGLDAIAKAMHAAVTRTPIKLFLMDFRMGNPDGGETSLQIRDIEVNGQKPFLYSIFVCVTGTPDDAKDYTIKDLENCFTDKPKGPKEVFHQVREKINTPQKCKDVIDFANSQLDKLASQQLGLPHEVSVSGK